MTNCRYHTLVISRVFLLCGVQHICGVMSSVYMWRYVVCFDLSHGFWCVYLVHFICFITCSPTCFLLTRLLWPQLFPACSLFSHVSYSLLGCLPASLSPNIYTLSPRAHVRFTVPKYVLTHFCPRLSLIHQFPT